jgi:hypothetical protein
MGKMIECHKVNPSSGCEHGLEPTPELMAQVLSHMEDEADRA